MLAEPLWRSQKFSLEAGTLKKNKKSLEDGLFVLNVVKLAKRNCRNNFFPLLVGHNLHILHVY